MSLDNRWGAPASALCAFALVSCGGQEQPPEEIIRPVRFQQVFATGGERVRTFSGVARATVESDMSFKVSGNLMRVFVKLGDNVPAGQLLAELDPQDYELRLEQAGATLARAQAEARNAKASYERMRALYEGGNASRNDLDQSRAAHESSQAQVEAADKERDLAQRRLEYTKLHAPVAGAIAQVPVAVNENVAAGQLVAVLTSGTRCEVQVGVPGMLIGQVREGTKVEVSFDAFRGDRFSGAVTEVGIAPTGMATTFPVTTLLDEADQRIRPGMAAEVAFDFSTDDQRERIIVPAVAVAEDREGRFVFVVERTADGLGAVHRREVEVGELTSTGLEIRTGLNDGDLLVTAGVHRLVDGQTVRVLDEGMSK
jgi:RND family efflux transporter MFP subunit